MASIPEPTKRKFVAEDLDLNDLSALEDYFKTLLDRPIQSKEDLEQWLEDRDELESVVMENGGWRFIRMTINTKDEEAKKEYEFFVSRIQPLLSPYSNKLDQKLVDSEFVDQLEGEGFNIHLRDVKKDIDLYREANIPLFSEEKQKAQEFNSISGAMTVELDGEEMTMQKASTFLKEPDRAKRKLAYERMAERRLKDKENLDKLFDDLVDIRHRIAQNADHENYRDYKFAAMGRFDYTPEDCFQLHDSIRKAVLPLSKRIAEKRKDLLGLEQLRPYDTIVDPMGRPPLKPFESEDELHASAKNIFDKVDPYFGKCLQKMKEMGHLDLASKNGKAPGGYNYPLMETGVPFIFMNAVGDHQDLVTMIHEGGHAVHSFLMQDLELSAFKQVPSEVAELASMSMELITLDHWNLVYPREEDLNRAKLEQMERVIKVLPWIATIDRFQHWIYENPDHTREDRRKNWERIATDLSTGLIDHTGYEEAFAYNWQKQLHLFEVPFYYIEYAMAQLGAIAVWKNYREGPEKALEQFKKALSLGYTRSIPEIYEEAGIRFDLSESYIKDLTGFIEGEIDTLENK